MAWTTPKDWAYKEAPSSTSLNEQLRDNMNALRDGSGIADSAIIPRKIDSVYKTDTGNGLGITTIADFWTDFTNISIDYTVAVQSTLTFAAYVEGQDNSTVSIYAFRAYITADDNGSVEKRMTAVVTGTLHCADYVLVMTGVTPGAKTIKFQFYSANNTAIVYPNECRLELIDVKSEA